MSPDELIDREMAYARQPHVDYTCRDPYAPEIECMRAEGHKGNHANGFGSKRVWWWA